MQPFLGHQIGALLEVTRLTKRQADHRSSDRSASYLVLGPANVHCVLSNKDSLVWPSPVLDAAHADRYPVAAFSGASEMEVILVGVVLIVGWLIMSYRSDKRAMSLEVNRLGNEVQRIIVTYKEETYDERPVIENDYLLGFIAGYLSVQFAHLGLKPATVRAHDLIPRVLDSSRAGSFNQGRSDGFALYSKMDQLASLSEGQFIRANEHGTVNAALGLNKLKAELMSHHLVGSAFQIAANKEVDASYTAVSHVHMELLFNSYAPRTRRMIEERSKQIEGEEHIFPFGE